jgi:(2Fe-2S) ferredoxin
VKPREDTCEQQCASVTGTGAAACAPWTWVDVSTLVDGRKRTVTYGTVTPAMVEKIVQEHIVGGEPIHKWIVLSETSPRPT